MFITGPSRDGWGLCCNVCKAVFTLFFLLATGHENVAARSVGSASDVIGFVFLLLD